MKCKLSFIANERTWNNVHGWHMAALNLYIVISVCVCVMLDYPKQSLLIYLNGTQRPREKGGNIILTFFYVPVLVPCLPSAC